MPAITSPTTIGWPIFLTRDASSFEKKTITTICIKSKLSGCSRFSDKLPKNATTAPDSTWELSALVGEDWTSSSFDPWLNTNHNREPKMAINVT
jgi:hypothetical protein